MKGGGQLESKQVVRRLTGAHIPYPGMVGEEEEKVGGREGGRGRGFVTCHLLWLCLGQEGGPV